MLGTWDWSPIGRRRTPPIRTTARSRSPSASPRRGRAPVGRRGRSSSYSGSPSPRKLPRRSRSRIPRRSDGSSSAPGMEGYNLGNFKFVNSWFTATAVLCCHHLGLGRLKWHFHYVAFTAKS
ncbi:hypothetical protein CMV_017946 [Castanea mollissima]|uniref:Uncharacterized protein n=1 Tax=Castanea mollissima TaxID=60419 RepID=A0A8J4QS98_9ROSI|nr:hypothetical protein CMV_017946 [Castanea mollissima]